MTLRARLATVVTVVLLLVIGMAITVVTLQRSQLVEQLDERLLSIAPLDRPGGNTPPPTPAAGEQTPGEPRPLGENQRQISDVYIAVVTPDGVVDVFVEGQLLVEVVDTSKFTSIPETRTFSNAESANGSASFRVLSEPTADGRATTVIAVPTAEVDQTVNRMTLAFAIVTVAIAAVLGALAFWVWRLSLVPLARIADTADAIANGERDQRVPEMSNTTEAGRVASALNTMLDERDESDDRLRQFVSDASHELRTPLTSIRGYLELYSAGGFRDEAGLDDAVRRMTDESERMTDLVDNLLHLARMDEGLALDIGPTDVGDLIRDVCAVMTSAHPGRSVIPEVPESGQLRAELDQKRVRQMLTGLVDNALIHGPEARVTVRGNIEDGSVLLAVTDNGPGMTNEEAACVFDRFYRGDSSRSRESGGSGLGLAIASMIAETHGGAIELATSLGVGSTFTIRLPAAAQ